MHVCVWCGVCVCLFFCACLQVPHQFPNFAHLYAWETEVAPGELLYVPPYTFHQVDSIQSPADDNVAISLTSWSHNRTLYGFLSELYGMPLISDKMESWEGKLYALRALIDLLITKLQGPDSSHTFVSAFVSAVSLCLLFIAVSVV